ncbi:MAG: hypothetical protein WAL59_28990, partial [Roseiarcus sp.]
SGLERREDREPDKVVAPSILASSEAPKFAAGNSPRGIRRTDSVIQLYRLGWLFLPIPEMNLDPGRARRSILRQTPCPGRKAETVPCSRELIPCSSAQGILSQTAEFADVLETGFRKKGLNRRNSPYDQGILAIQET